ncbi:indoleamine 2,3-dioxygenase [Ceratobasidium sp. AG-Ba]|nr:indoleamine 2,3-dioxygenase [Ceratobasidium sp. AG-Ba]
MNSPGVDYLSVLKESVLPNYSVSPATGFAPPKSNPPAVKFSSPALKPWLEVSQKISELLRQSNATFRSSVDHLPLLSMPDDAPVEEWRLAYVLLSTLAAAYVWGSTTEAQVADKLPYVLASPLREVSYELEVEPGITYASGGIWNHLYNESVSSNEDSQLKCIVSFTGTPDEDHFNLTTLRVERAGGPGVVHGMMAGQQVIKAIRYADFTGDRRRSPGGKDEDAVHDAMADSLNGMAFSIDQCRTELRKMRDGCEPSVFYNQLRPFLSGFGSGPSLPKGVFYPSDIDGTPENGKGEWLKLSGATAGQSSLFQAFDILLDVEHPATGETNRAEFVKSMRRAMPGATYSNLCLNQSLKYFAGCHVQFLESLSALPSLRKYMKTLQAQDDTISQSALNALQAYNSALYNLEQFRAEHFKIVALYVIGPARRAAQATLVHEPDESQLRGTGGSNLASLLKGMRTDTKDTVLPRD